MTYDHCLDAIDDSERDDLRNEAKWSRRNAQRRAAHWHPHDPEYEPRETDDEDLVDQEKANKE